MLDFVIWFLFRTMATTGDTELFLSVSTEIWASTAVLCQFMLSIADGSMCVVLSIRILEKYQLVT